MTASEVKAISIPATDSPCPNIPRRPKAISRASPATAGGRTVGRSISVSSARRPRKRRRVISTARGVPRTIVNSVAVADVHRLSTIARRATGWARCVPMSVNSVRQISASSGRVRNRIMGTADQKRAMPGRDRRPEERWSSRARSTEMRIASAASVVRMVRCLSCRNVYAPPRAVTPASGRKAVRLQHSGAFFRKQEGDKGCCLIRLPAVPGQSDRIDG